MLIQKMTRSECLGTLAGARLGRLACAQGDQPYAVPFYFVYHEPYLYGFTTPGQKTEWMRANPHVCVELDEVDDAEQWMSVILFGRYEELPDALRMGRGAAAGSRFAPAAPRLVGARLCFLRPARSQEAGDTDLLSYPHRSHHRPAGYAQRSPGGQVKDALPCPRLRRLAAQGSPRALQAVRRSARQGEVWAFPG
jgi:hypothetical protein